MPKKNTLVISVVALLVLILGLNSMFIVEEGYQAITVQLGEIKHTYTNAGINFKVPFVQNVEIFPKMIKTWSNKPDDIITNDKEYLQVDVTARWKIVDPVLFYKVNRTVRQSYSKLDNVLDPQIKTVIARNNRVEVIRSTNNMLEYKDKYPSSEDSIITNGRASLSEQIKAGVEEDLKKQGIEITEIIFTRVRFSDNLTASVYDSMIKSRNVIAAQYRAEGEGAKQEIIGQTDKRVREIRSEAKAYAQETMGAADAKAAKIYSEAYDVDPEFYSFWRALESYKETLPRFNKTFSTDMEYFQYLYSSR